MIFKTTVVVTVLSLFVESGSIVSGTLLVITTLLVKVLPASASAVTVKIMAPPTPADRVGVYQVKKRPVLVGPESEGVAPTTPW